MKQEAQAVKKRNERLQDRRCSASQIKSTAMISGDARLLRVHFSFS